MRTLERNRIKQSGQPTRLASTLHGPIPHAPMPVLCVAGVRSPPRGQRRAATAEPGLHVSWAEAGAVRMSRVRDPDPVTRTRGAAALRPAASAGTRAAGLPTARLASMQLDCGAEKLLRRMGLPPSACKRSVRHNPPGLRRLALCFRSIAACAHAARASPTPPRPQLPRRRPRDHA